MNDLPLEKQFAHRSFCDTINKVGDVEFLRAQVRQLHLLYLRQQATFAQVAKSSMLSPPEF